MGNRRLYETECIHTPGTPEFERLKVTALNLFHPTASPPFQKVASLVLQHSLLMGEGRGGGANSIFILRGVPWGMCVWTGNQLLSLSDSVIPASVRMTSKNFFFPKTLDLATTF